MICGEDVRIWVGHALVLTIGTILPELLFRIENSTYFIGRFQGFCA
jgi:hypothetical protein